MKWSDNRNRCCVEVIRNEMLFALNVDSILEDNQLLKARSDKAYTRKIKKAKWHMRDRTPNTV